MIKKYRMKRIILFFLLFVLVYISGCSRTQITFTSDKLVFLGDMPQLIPVTDSDVEFVIANQEVIEIVDGKIYPLEAGRTSITIKDSLETLEVIVLPQVVCPTSLVEKETVELTIANYFSDIHDFNFIVEDDGILSLNDTTLSAVARGQTKLTVALKTDEEVAVNIIIEVIVEKPIILLSREEVLVDDVFSLSVENYKEEFIYTSSDETILEIVGSAVFALKAGKATITATSKNDDQIVGTIDVVVKGQTPILRANAIDYKVGQTFFIPIINYSDYSLFEWSVSDKNVISIDENYQITALTPGNVSITVTKKDDKTLKTTIDLIVYPVKPMINLANNTIQLGQKVKLEILNYTNKEDFIWKIGDSSILNINNYLLEAIQLGTTTVTATSKTDANLTDSITVTVIPILPILNATFENMRVGDVGYLWISNLEQMGASADDFLFTVDDSTIMKLEKDKMTALKEGMVTITATLKDNSVVTTKSLVTITKTSTKKTENGEINEGPLLLYTQEEGARLLAGVMSYVYIDKAVETKNYRWVTSDATIATVNDSGRVIAITAGKVTITAISKENKEVKGTIILTIYGEPNVDYVSRLIAIATEELGYVEGPNNDTKYGAWYNLNYEAWCAMFVSWCCNEAGISTKIVPRYCGCTAGMAWFVNEGRFGARGEYTPKPGDIVFYRDKDKTTGSTHTGIVIAVDNNRVYTIEGNTSDMVAKRNYALTNSYIVGYGIPNYPPFDGQSGGGDIGGSTPGDGHSTD
ncbi:MAG TPA: Ig-like domain-containing protein [Bacilli bacterium]|nr:Ig-like domain-containing protein [Bacilli bacterium]